ncbi:MAG: manganese efflux pump MntP family protein, partial [Spirochaetaceae bacterium]|nr:manganese efflux pump MntP family protein [Spirochaetaceae bacterium]
AFRLLAFIGGKMLTEGFDPKKQIREGDNPPGGTGQAGDIRGTGSLLTLSLATSIDALAVGISFNILGHGIWSSAALIGGITFLVCLVGFGFGRRIGRFLGKWAERVGGFVLIAIGSKILLEHLVG